jgi:hypothetical protein
MWQFTCTHKLASNRLLNRSCSTLRNTYTAHMYTYGYTYIYIQRRTYIQPTHSQIVEIVRAKSNFR